MEADSITLSSILSMFHYRADLYRKNTAFKESLGEQYV